MLNPRRSSFSSNQNSENLFHTQNDAITSLLHFLKKPLSFPFLLSIFLFLTWVSLRLQTSSSPVSSRPYLRDSRTTASTRALDLKANLVRFSPSQIAKDKRGWLLNPVSVASNAGVLGGAVSCVQVHLGEIRPGGVRGNHRHHTCNETFVIWGAETKFRLENGHTVDQDYAEVIVGADEVGVAASPNGIAHALVNVDPLRTTFFLGCQDGAINYNSSDSNVWKDL